MANFLKSFFIGKTEETESDRTKNDKKNFELFKFDGLRAQRIGQLDYAIKCFHEALSIENEYETRSYLASAYLQQNKLDDARETYAQLIQMEPSIPEPYMHHAQICYMQEAYEESVNDCLTLLQLDNSHATTYLLLAKGYWGMKNEINAIANLTKALELDKEYSEAYLTRARYLYEMRQFTCVAQDLEAALALNPDDEPVLLLRGELHEALNNEAALDDYNRVIELNPFNEQAYLCLGKLFITQKKLDEAIETFDEAIEINPHFAKAYHERGRAKLLNGNKEGSFEDMKKAMEFDKEMEESISGQFDNSAEKFDSLLGFVH